MVLKGIDDFMAEREENGDVVGSWGFNSNLNFSKMKPEENNIWFFEQVFNFLRSFFGLVTPDNMELVTYNATQKITKKDLDQQTFLDELMLVLKKLKEPLWTLRLNLTILGFLRKGWDPSNPIRVHIQEPTSLIIWGGPDETGFQTFSIGYTLFSSTVLDEKEGTELWSMNQPLLEKSLKKWEKQTGRMIEVVDSTGGMPVNQYGFEKPGAKGTTPRRPGANPAAGVPPRRPNTKPPPVKKATKPPADVSSFLDALGDLEDDEK
jgi:hypothetical protein